jgi:hypothetical protein
MQFAAARPATRFTALVATLALALAPAARAGQVYGTAPDLAVTTPVSEILAKPAEFVGKVVKVQGMVVDVCASRGCWLELGGDKAFETIRIKVKDGDIVFPLSARGRKAFAQGKLESISMNESEARRFREHQALEKGVAFDPKSAAGPLTIYQIKPTGVLVE